MNRLRFLLSAGLGIAVCLLTVLAGARADATRASHHATRASHHATRASHHATRAGHAESRLAPVPQLQSTDHIATWAFDDACNGGAGASQALVRRWATLTESDCGPKAGKARSDCHAAKHAYCTVMQYLDPDWNFPVEAVPVQRASSAGWWLHEPSPHQRTRITDPSFGGGHLLNQTNPAVRAFFRAYARRYYNSDDGLLLDWQSPSLSQELYYSNCRCTSTSEIRSDAALRRAHEQMSAELTHRGGAPFIQADNTLPPNPYLPQGLDMLNHSIGVDGWVVEGEPVDDGTFDPYYSTLLDQIAYVATRTRGFVVPMARAAAGAPYQRQSRRVAEGTMLLGYSPGHLVDWANLETGSPDLAVWPEEGIFPTEPAESMQAPGGRGCLAGKGTVCSRGGHNDLEVAPGVYRREFRACYDQGLLFGPCATIVNTRNRAVIVSASWLKSSFGHEIAFQGGDVQSGGALELSGAAFSAGSSVVGPEDAVLLAP
jgi:hypothetical protein